MNGTRIAPEVTSRAARIRIRNALLEITLTPMLLAPFTEVATLLANASWFKWKGTSTRIRRTIEVTVIAEAWWNNNRSNRYSSHTQQCPADNNNIESSSRVNKNDSDSEDNYAIEEELHVLTEEDADQGVKSWSCHEAIWYLRRLTEQGFCHSCKATVFNKSNHR